jgi:hypothetical protein
MKRFLISIALMASSIQLPGQILIDPILDLGLSPGDTFRMLFVTSTTTDATSSDIAVYDAFVTTAASGISFTNTDIASPSWEAIVSTGQGFTELSASLHTDSFPNCMGPTSTPVHPEDSLIPQAAL